MSEAPGFQCPAAMTRATVRDVAGQPDPAIIPAGQREAGQRPAQPPDPDHPAVGRGIDAAVTAAVHRLQAQLREHAHPLRPARQRVAGLEQAADSCHHAIPGQHKHLGTTKETRG